MRSEMTLARHFSRSCGIAAHHAAVLTLAALAVLVSPLVAAHAQQTSDWQPTVTDDTGAKKPGKKKPGAKAATPPAEEAPTTTAKADPTIPVIKPGTQSIVALINDEPITGYEIDERVTLSLLGSPELQQRMQAKLKAGNVNDQFKAFALKRLQADPPKTEAEQQARVKLLQAQFVESLKGQVMAEFKPTARQHALEELIEERLKMQEATRLNVVAEKDDVDRIVNGMAERNKMTPAQFAEHISKMGANIAGMRQRIKVSLSWADVIRRLYGHQIAVTSRDIDRFVATAEGQDDVELRVHRILLAVPPDQKQIAKRLSDAEAVRAKFDNCKSTSTLAGSVSGARFDDLGDRRPGTIPEPTRSLLLAAHDNEMLPPTIGEGGVELWAVCSRKIIKAEDAKRQTAESELRQKEFEVLSKKHLKDLRQDAHIEYR
jgi:peptidyl-prolyl cis-trans isomerase SurA